MEVTDAIIIAAGTVRDPELARAANGRHKSFIPLNGRPAVSYVVENLKRCGHISRTVVVAGEECRQAVVDVDVFVDGSDGVNEAVLAGIDAVKESERCLLMTGDMPLASAQAIEDFLDSAPDADVVYPIVEKSVVKAAFPERLSSYLHLTEGAFTGSSCLLFRPQAASQRMDTLQKLLEARDNPAGLVGVLGVGFAMKMMFGKLSVNDLETRLSEAFGLECRAFVTSHPELLVSIDSKEDLAIVEEALSDVI